MGIGLHNYHDTHNSFPPALGGTDQLSDPATGAWRNWHIISFHVVMLPFCEQQARYEMLVNSNGGAYWSSVNANIEAYKGLIPYLACPSDSNAGDPCSWTNNNMRCSYPGSWGDSIYGCDESGKTRGFFGTGGWPERWAGARGMAQLTDGTSNTLAIAEQVVALAKGDGQNKIKGNVHDKGDSSSVKPKTCLAVINPADTRTFVEGKTVAGYGRGDSFSDGRPGINGIQTILPPNSPNCRGTNNNHPGHGYGLCSASSYHSGGINGVLADGSVRFFSETIDCGNLDKYDTASFGYSGFNVGNSYYGVWGAYGSINGGETQSL